MSTQPNTSRRPESDELRSAGRRLASCRLRFGRRRSCMTPGRPVRRRFRFATIGKKGYLS